MPRRSDFELLSPRAMARLHGPRTGYVPTLRDLEVDPRAAAGGGSGGRAGGRVGRHGSRLPGRPWVRLPVALEGARWQPGGTAVLGIVVLTLLAIAVFGLRVAWARSEEERVLAPGGGSRAGPTGVAAGVAPVGVPAGAPGADPGGGQSGGPAATPGASGRGGQVGGPAASGAGRVVVHVVGQVRAPGVLYLAAGSRVADALEAAGGPTEKADLSRVNLARVLVDGEQVHVPAPGDPATVVAGGGVALPGAGDAGAGTGGGGATGSGVPIVALNTADLAALDTLPGIGPVLAQRILDWRAQHGRFTSVDELGEVSGIGEKLLAQLRPLVTL